MDWPIFFKERISLINTDKGFIGVVTLWTPKEILASSMPAKVAAVGQLYTKGGIEYIIRNLWARPSVSVLLVCGDDRTGSGRALVNFLKGKKLESLKDSLIEEKFLSIFQNKVKVVDLIGEKDPRVIARKIEKIPFSPPFAEEPKSFPLPTIPESFPSEKTAFRVEGETVGQAWIKILKTVCRFGWEIPRIHVYGGSERMVLNLTAVVSKEDIRKPKIYPFFDFDEKGLKNYLREFFNPDRGEQAYTYGERLFKGGVDQVALMVNKLKQFPYNKGGLAVLWQPKIDNFPKRKPWRTPCLTLIQGICQGDHLHLTAYFRSNDMFGAWPLNAFALRRLQTVLAAKIDRLPGLLTTISSSAFIDMADLAASKGVIDKYDLPDCQWDPRGNFVIKVENKQIKVTHFSPDGSQTVGEYQGKTASEIYLRICRNDGVSLIPHALYLGSELEKAETALKKKLKYVQDKSLKF